MARTVSLPVIVAIALNVLLSTARVSVRLAIRARAVESRVMRVGPGKIAWTSASARTVLSVPQRLASAFVVPAGRDISAIALVMRVSMARIA